MLKYKGAEFTLGFCLCQLDSKVLRWLKTCAILSVSSECLEQCHVFHPEVFAD
jgi:hypothetical protein